MRQEHCVCGRKLPPSHPGLGPKEAELLRRIEFVRAARVDAASQDPPDFSTMRGLTTEERELRAQLTRMIHQG